jgi:hypothetical protein
MKDVPPLDELSVFQWPEGKRAALSLTFDDARLSQPDTGFEILDRHGVRATFYVSPHNVEKRLEAWRQAVARGHEIGNHTVSHPCAGAAAWTRHNALEDYTLKRIAAEIDDATAQLRTLLGVTPQTFAYPCGQDWVGRGRNRCSYVPLVAERFLIGRGGGGIAIPGYADPAMMPSIGLDQLTFDRYRALMTRAEKEGLWLILAGHEIASDTSCDNLTTFPAVLEEICRHANNPANGVWVDTVAAIGTHVREQRSGSE